MTECLNNINLQIKGINYFINNEFFIFALKHLSIISLIFINQSNLSVSAFQTLQTFVDTKLHKLHLR